MIKCPKCGNEISSYTTEKKVYYTKNKKEIIKKNYQSLKLRRLKAKKNNLKNIPNRG